MPETKDKGNTGTEGVSAEPADDGIRGVDAGGLVRARLTGRLADPASYRLAWIVAPAGSGKSRLLAHVARAFPGPVAWAGAPNPVPRTEAALVGWLWSSLVQGVPVLDGGRPPAGVADLLDLIRPHPGPVAVVLDDVHLMEGTEAEDGLSRLVEGFPPAWRLLVASRVHLGPDLSRLRVSGAVIDIGPDDLRFRTWEVEELFRDVYREPLLPEDVAVLTRRTAGWAAYLQMFFLATSRRPQAERRTVLGTLQHRPRLVSEYLARHALAGLSAELQSFLLRTSVLRRPNAALCEELLGWETGAAGMLAELERRQLFTERLADGSYRYHAVLLAYLDAKLVDTLGLEAARAEHRKAGQLLEREGWAEDALAAYARSEDWAGVERILGQAGRTGSELDEIWMAALPPGVVDSDALLLLVKARRAMARGDLAEAVQVLRRAEAVAPSDAVAERARALRETALAWSEPAHPLQGDWIGVLRRATQRQPLEGRRAAEALSGPYGRFVQGAAAFLAGDMAAAARTMRSVAGRPDASATISGAAALIAYAAGVRLGRASAMAERVQRLEEIEASGIPWLARVARAVLAGDEPVELDVAEDLVAACERHGDRWGGAIVQSAMGLAALVSGRREASGLLAAAAEAYRRLGAGVLEATLLAYSALASAREGRDDAARRDGGRARTMAAQLEVPLAAGVSALASAVVSGRPSAPAAREILEPLGVWDWHAAVAGLSGPGTADRAARPTSPGVDLPSETVGPLAGATHGDGVAPVAVRLLGRFALEIAGKPVDEQAAKPMERALLRILALRAGQAVHREELIAALWPDADADAGLHRLQVAVSSLRRLLGRSGPDSGDLVARSGDSYRLALPEGALVDAAAFEQAAAEAAAARSRGDDGAERDSLVLANRLYGGPVIPDAGPAEWVVAPRRRLVSMYGDVCARLGQIFLEEGDPRQASRTARAGLEADQYRDELWKVLIASAEAGGNHAEAEQTRRDYEAVLNELGV